MLENVETSIPVSDHASEAPTKELSPQPIELQRKEFESPQENTAKALAAGKLLIQQRLEGFFSDTKERAKLALQYKGGEYTTEEGARGESKRLLALLDTLDAIPEEETGRITQAISKNLVITVGKGEIKRELTWKQWKQELDAAIRTGDPQKIQELENPLLEHRFPEEAKQEQNQTTPEKSPEDILISKYEKSFEQEFKKAEERGDVHKEQMEKIEETLILLRLAEEAKGNEGVILKHLALKNLRDNHGVQGLDGAVNDLQEKASAAIDKVSKLMDQAKAEEFRSAIKEGKLEDMIRSGKLFKVEGMSELLFGKDMAEEKLKEILRIDKKNKWKDPLLLALIIMLIGPMEIGKEVIPLSK